MSALSLLLVVVLSFSSGLSGAYLSAAGEPGTATAAPAAVTAGTAVSTYEGPGFDTPQETITCYLEGLKNLDFEQMLHAFAWETQARHYDVEVLHKRLRVYSPSVKPRMPSFNDFMLSATLHELRSSQVDLIYQSLESYILGEDYHQGRVITFKEDADADAYLQKFDNGRLENLRSMSNIRFLSPDTVTDNKFSLEKNQQNFIKQSAYYGADEVVNIVALADVGSDMLYCCPTVARYGDRWYLVSVSSFTSSLLGVSINYQAFMCGQGL
ncbi:MAG: hypothetical protein II879_05540 [Clostridia bacterium]|nr:hypothetical protein [Clostridia bacterium]